MSTGIQWTDETWNPTRGCSRVSPGCVNCYAERTAMRQIHDGYKGLVHISNGHPSWTGVVRAMTGKTLEAPLHWKKPRRIFVNSMSDLFHESLPDEAIDRIFAVMALCQQHTFQVLTKRADRMLAYVSRLEKGIGPLEAAARELGHTFNFQGFSLLAWPIRNLWLGVSVENQKYADERIPLLLQTPAAIRFVSYEPALGAVDFTRISAKSAAPYDGEYWLDALRGRGFKPSPLTALPIEVDFDALDWIIVGGESGPGARPFDVAWARDTIEQCRAAGVACFVKQLGARPFKFPSKQYLQLFQDRKGGDPSEWPENLRVREFPALRTQEVAAPL